MISLSEIFALDISKFRLDNIERKLYTLKVRITAWGISSAGRALHWQCKGQRFDPAMLHQLQISKTLKSYLLSSFFLCLKAKKDCS